ncbi:MAG: HNH endonuclease [Dethiosulfatibacter sp.]|nr:HNH endonuclease [Dethiosulfatibacter sp.]
MPTKPKRPCSMSSCGRLCENGEQYCSEHKQVANKHYNKFQRDPKSNKRYGRAWKRIRDRYIKAHPLCVECQKNGFITPAEEVHHIIPLSKGGGNEISNLMSLCKSCHSRITVEMGDRWGR